MALHRQTKEKKDRKYRMTELAFFPGSVNFLRLLKL